jgi:hypothetical protein
MPFSYIDNPAQQIYLAILLIVWAMFLFGGFVFGSPGSERRMPVWTRLASSAVLVVAGFSWAILSRGTPAAGYGVLIAAGMFLGFFGDLSLANLFLSGRKAQLAGIGAFALGHLCYIPAIWLLGQDLGLTSTTARLGALTAWWFFGALGWYFVVFRPASTGSLRWIVLPYALLLATTAGVASGLALLDPAFWPLALGAVLFLISDMILGGNWFSGLEFPYIHDVIWLTYGPGQMLIVFSVGAAIAAS